jgi:hypothetical protein
MATGGRSCSLSLVMLSCIPSSVPVTALIGMTASLRPRKGPFSEKYAGHVAVAGVDFVNSGFRDLARHAALLFPVRCR